MRSACCGSEAACIRCVELCEKEGGSYAGDWLSHGMLFEKAKTFIWFVLYSCVSRVILCVREEGVRLVENRN
jgi:hypothetical protein